MSDVGTDRRIQQAAQHNAPQPQRADQKPQEHKPSKLAGQGSKSPTDEVHLSETAQHEVEEHHHDPGGHGGDHEEGDTYAETTHGAKYTSKAIHAAEEIALLRAFRHHQIFPSAVSAVLVVSADTAETLSTTAPDAPTVPKPAPEPTPALKLAPEVPKPAVKAPISEDMRLYVEAVENARAEEAALKAKNATPPPAPKPAVEVPTTPHGEGATHAAEHAAHGGKLHKVMRGVDKVVGPAAVVAGGLEVAHGIHELKAGKYVDGGLDVTAGVAGTASGVAGTTMAFTSATAGTTVAGVTLGTVAIGGAGIAAAADGVKDIYHGVKEGNGEQVGIGGAKTVAGGLMLAGAATGNPILVAGGAVVYVGAVVYENREAIGKFAKDTAHTVAGGIKKACTATRELAGNVANKVSEKASQVKKKAGEVIDAGKKRVAEIYDAAKQKASEAITTVAEKAKEIKSAVSSTVSSAASSAWGWARLLPPLRPAPVPIPARQSPGAAGHPAP